MLPTETIFPEPPPPPGLLAIQAFLKRQDPYRVNNWRALLATNARESLKCIHVSEEVERDRATGQILGVSTVANIASPNVLIRIEDAHLLPGFYLLAETVARCPPRAHWSGYPNISVAEPDLGEIEALGAACLPREVCGAFCVFAEEVKKHSGQICIEKDGAYMVQRPDYPFNFPFGIREPAVVNASALIIAMKEAHTYEKIFFSRQRSTERPMPLFFGFGNNWRNCILVSTQQKHLYEQTSLID